jgi:oligopeptide transport system substrate-binding protein
MASRLLEELGYASPGRFPVLTTSPSAKFSTLAEYFQNVCRNLGIEIAVRQLKRPYWRILQPALRIARTGWGPDYDDPFTYLDMWDSRGGWNKTGWVGENFYTLTGEANKQTDFKKRNDMFFEAEKILLTEAPIIPLYMSRGALVLSDKIKDVSINTFNARFDSDTESVICNVDQGLSVGNLRQPHRLPGPAGVYISTT